MLRCYIVLLAIIACAVCTASTLRLSEATALPAVRLVSVDFDGLIMQDKSTVLASVTALSTIGALQIKGIPGFSKLREESLGSLADCMAFESSTEVSMNDGSKRRTIAIGSNNGVPDLWDSQNCRGNVESISKLRTVVDAAARQLFIALDLSVDRSSADSLDKDKKNTYVMEPYTSFLSIFDKGEHLEHFHTYYPSPQKPQNDLNDRPATMDFHTDSGLLIAMTSGYYHESSTSKGENDSLFDVRGLYIEMPTGAKARAQVDDDALIIMVGRGGEDWISPALVGRGLRAVPHALIAGLDAAHNRDSILSDGSDLKGPSRSWYGKMFQPPHNAFIENSKIRDKNDNPLTYSAFRSLEINSFLSKKSNSVSQPAACGDNYSRALTSKQDGISYLDHYNAGLLSSDLCVTSSGKVGLYCWMQCQAVDDLLCGHDARCYDTVSKTVVPGDITCPSGSHNCKLECVSPASEPEMSFDGYCFSSGTAMIMAGFTSIAWERPGSTPCLNLLFTSWTLNSKLKYFFACIGTFALGIVIQYISKCRSERAKDNVKPSTTGNAIVLLLFFSQMVLSYFAMLAAMTYSIEIFSMVIVGLTAGFGFFNLKRPAAESIEPCCNYSEVEDEEGLALKDRSHHNFEKLDD